MARIKLSAAARRDLVAIDAYGAEHFGEDVASAYSRGFKEAFALLSELPLSGQARPEYRPGTRCKMHQRHRILYRVSGETVFVQRILHHSQNVPAHLRS